MEEQKVILITGTRKGIGEALCKHYLSEGWIVIGCSRSDPEWTKEKTYPDYHHFLLDVADEKAVVKMFAAVRKEFHRLDALINNAGIASMNHSLLTPIDTVERIFRTNAVGTFLCCREAAKLMQRRKVGRIVNFSTVATPLDLEGESAYAASKAAIVSMTRTLAREYADYGITVNAVGPVPIQTDLIRGVPEEKMKALVGRQAIRRYGEYRDVINVIDFYLQDASDFITGQVLYLGGV